MPSAKKAVKKVSKKELKKAAREKLVLSLRKIRPQLVGAANGLENIRSDKALDTVEKKTMKRLKTARKAIDKVLELLIK